VPQRHPMGAHSFFVPAQIFQTSDGYLALFVTHDEFWRIFATEVGRTDWLTDQRFATMRARNEYRSVVVADIARELARQPTRQWTERLRPLGVVVAGIATLPQALADEGVAARRMIAHIQTSGGTLRLIANPIKIDGYEERYEPPPALGEHNDLIQENGKLSGVR
jgi:CoA:oxalate CoA-transferase